jgi:uncharacterized protein YcbX
MRHSLCVRVAQLWRYPVKSMQGERLPAVTLGPGGVVGDRRWGVLDGTTVLAGKRTPQLLEATARVTAAGAVEVRLPGDRCVTAGPEGDGALSGWLGRPVRLEEASPDRAASYEVPEDDGAVRSVPCPPGSFQDSRSSDLHLLTARTAGGDDVRVYRPNVVLDADVAPFGEDEWVGRTLRIGPAEVAVTKPCARCVLVVHPQPGIEGDRARLTRLRDRGAALGVLARVTVPGVVRVGDPVELLPA